MRRPLGQSLDIRKEFYSEDGKHYRGLSQPHDRIKRLVAEQSELNELRPAKGRTFLGAIPMVVLIDWLKERGASMDQYARNEGNIANEFKQWLAAEYPKLLTDVGRKHLREINRGNIR